MKNLQLLLTAIVTFTMIQFKTFAQFNNTSTNISSSFGGCINKDSSKNLIYRVTAYTSNILYLYKSDSLNNVIWKKQITFLAGQIYESTVKVVDNNIFILAFPNNPRRDFFFLIKIDANGNLIWSKKITGGSPTIEADFISITKQNNIYIGFGSCSYNNTFLKLDSLGNYIWSKYYHINSSPSYDGVIATFTETDAEGLLILSNFQTIPAKDLMMFYEINSSGNLVWDKFFKFPIGTAGLGGDLTFKNIKRDLQGNYYFNENLQENNHNAIIVKTDSIGNLIWSKMYKYQNSYYSRINQIDLDTKGNLYTGGYGYNYNGDTVNNVVMKISTLDGEILNAWRNYGPTNTTFYAIDMKCTNDNRIVLVGRNQAVGAIAAIDSLGNGICGMNPISMMAMPYPIYDTTITPILSSQSINVIDTTFIIQSSTINPTPFCFTTGVSENIMDNSILIYPNPFASQTTITFSSEQTNTTLYIRDVLGREIKEVNFTGKEYVLEKGEMQAGIYFVQIIDANKKVTNRKVVVK